MYTNIFSLWLEAVACLVFIVAMKYNQIIMIRVIYAFFLGLLLVLFVGIGIQAFYPAPKYPDPSSQENRLEPGIDKTIPHAETTEEKAAREAYDKKIAEFRVKNNQYNRDVSIIALGFAIVLLVTSLLLIQKIDVIADGLLLGGVFNLLYSIGRGFATDDQKYQFFIVTIGLFIALVLGYFKFIRPTQLALHSEKPKDKDK